MTEILALHGISKGFPGVQALEEVSFALGAGEVTALVGENGAGKSTIVKILTGIYRPDRGRIEMEGIEQSFASPRDAWAAGIAAIHQETVMFDELTVAENIFMGHMPGGRLIDRRAMARGAGELLARVGAAIAPGTKLKRLSVAQKHVVAIARALSHEARVIIMDEPTASLSRREIDDLFVLVGQLRAEGRAILFISHKFDEIFGISDRWACLRDGRKVGEGRTEEVTEGALVRLMVGRPIEQVFPKRAVPLGEVVLRVEGLSNATEYADVTFGLRRGEILGLYGLIGAGRSEAMQGLFGLTRRTRGRIEIEGREMGLSSPAEAIAAGLAYVPEDRQVQGAILPFGIRENVTLVALGDHVRRGFLSRASELAATRRLGERLRVRAASWEQRLAELSGGNQQKVVLARWLAARPRIVVLDEPTKGIDIGAKAAVHEFIGELVAEGLAVILVSSELPEVMGLADRLLVFREGRIVARLDRPDFSAEAIGAAATGARERAA
ncbi:MAG TPA: sugar ABC transporter ATP-binding protein [Paracoccaceae bacterium]|nr:sugar ABC transporter ATP-binding protein [Paracoccaceae bacterium]